MESRSAGSKALATLPLALALAAHLLAGGGDVASVSAQVRPPSGGPGVSGPSVLAPRERAVYRMALRGDALEDACDAALEVTLPDGFRLVHASEALGSADPVRGLLTFVALPKVAAGTEETIELELEAPARPTSGALCASIAYGRCAGPSGSALPRDLRAGPACIPLSVPAPAPVPTTPPVARVPAVTPGPRTGAPTSNATSANATVPCGTRPTVFQGGSAFTLSEWADALVVNLATPTPTTMYIKTNADDLFVAFEVQDGTRNNSDAIKLDVNVNADGGTPEAVDRAFQVTRTGNGTQYRGSGAGFGIAMTRNFTFEVQDFGPRWAVEMRIPLSELAGPVDPFETVGLGVEVKSNGPQQLWPATFDGRDETQMLLHDLLHCVVPTCNFTTWSQSPDLLDLARMTPIERVFDSVAAPNGTYGSARMGTSVDVRATRFGSAGSTGVVLRVEALLPLYTDAPLTDDQIQVEVLVGGVSYGRVQTTAADLSPHVGLANAGIVALDLTSLYLFQMTDFDPAADLDLRVTGLRGGAAWDNASLFLDGVGLRVTTDGTCGTFSAYAPDVYVTKDDGYAQVVANGLLTYQIAYGNRGSSTATSVTIVDVLPTNSRYHRGQTGISVPVGTTSLIEYSVASGPWTTTEPAELAQNVRIRFTVPLVAPTDPNVYFAAFQTRVDPAAQLGDRVLNQVTASLTQGDANPLDNSDWDDGPTQGDDLGDIVGTVAIPSVTIPCILRPASHDGAVDPAEYQGAAVRNISDGRGGFVQVYMYHDLNYVYFGFIVYRMSTGADNVGLTIDSFNNKLDPDSTDHRYNVRGNRRAAADKGVGSNTDRNYWTNDNGSRTLIAMRDISSSAWSAEFFVPLTEIGVSGQGDVIGIGLFSAAAGPYPSGADDNNASTWANAILGECSPQAFFSAPPACAGSVVSLTDLSTNGPIVTWTWDFGDGQPGSSVQSPSHLYAAAGVYNVTLTVCDASSRCGTRTLPVTVNPAPVARIVPSATRVCVDPAQAAVVTLDATSSTPVQGAIPDPTGYAWTTTLGTLSAPNGSVVTLTVPPGTSGQAVVTLVTTDAPNGCAGTASVTLDFSPPPVAALVTLPAQFCSDPLADMTVRLDASSSTATAPATVQGFAWSVPAGQSVSGSGPAVDWIIPAGTTGSHTATVTVTDSTGCTDATPVTVVIDVPGQAAFTMSPRSPVCTTPGAPLAIALDGSLSVPGAGAIPVNGFEWSASAGTVGTSQAVSETLTLPPGTTGTIQVCLRIQNTQGCMSRTICQPLIVEALPVPAFATSVPPVSCSSAAAVDVDLDASTTTGGSIPDPSGYHWFSTPAGTGPIPDGRTSRVTFPPGFTGTVVLDLVVTDAAGCTATTSRTIELRSGPTPVLLPAASQRCTDNAQAMTTPLDASGSFGSSPIADPAGYAWTATAPGTVSPTTGSLATLTVPAGFVGIVTVGLTVTDADGCSRSTTVDQTYTDGPGACMAPTPPDVCGSLTIATTVPVDAACTTGQGVLGYTWSVTPPATVSPANTPQATVTFPPGFVGNVTVTLDVTSGASCSSQTTRTITVHGEPVVAVTPAPASACTDPAAATSFTLDASGSGIASVAWSAVPPATVVPVTATTATLTVPAGFVGNASATATATTSFGCVATATLDVPVHALPTPLIVPSATQVCDRSGTGATFDLDARTSTFPGGLPATGAFQWVASVGTVTPTSANGDQARLAAPAGFIGTVTVTLTVTDGRTCAASASLDLEVVPGPTAAIVLASTRLCESTSGAVVSLDGSSSTGTIPDPAGYVWSATQGTFPGGNTGSRPSLTLGPGVVGAVDVTLVVTDANGCVATRTERLDVVPLPVPLFTLPASVCSSDTPIAIPMDARSSTAGTSIPDPTGFVWTSSAVVTPGQGSQVSLAIPAGTAGSVPVSLAVTDQDGCTATLTRTLDVLPRPVASLVVGPATTLCDGPSGTDFTLDASGSTGSSPLSYAWSTTAGAIVGAGPTPTLHLPQGASGATVTLTVNDQSGCPRSVDAVVTVRTPPTARPVVAAPTTCSATSAPAIVDLDGAASDAAPGATIVSYLWTVTGGGTIVAPTAAQTTVTYPAGVSGSFVATLAVTDSFGCMSSATVPFTVRSGVAPSASLVATPTVCAVPGSATTVALDASGSSATSPATIASFAWTASPGATLGGSVGPFETLTVPAGVYGRFQVRVTVTDSTGCTASQDLDVDVIEPPLASLFTLPRACELAAGTPVALTATAVGHHPNDPALTYAWTASEGSPVAAVAAPTVLVPWTGLARDVALTLTVTDAAGCMSPVVTGLVHLSPSPVADFTATAGAAGSPSNFDSAPTTGGSLPYTYSWRFGDGGSSTQPAPVHTYTTAGSYTVVLDVTDVTGCTSSRSRTLDVTDGGRLAGHLEVGTACTSSALALAAVVTGGTLPYDTQWTFGDGATAHVAGTSTTHVYNAAGPFQVRAVVTDAQHLTITLDGVATPDPTPALSAVTSGPALVGVLQTFTATVGGAPGSTVLWSFSDGGSATGTSCTHTFVTSGPATAVATVTSPAGCVATASVPVDIDAGTTSVVFAKSALPMETTAGGEVVYTLAIQNGHGVLQTVHIEDRLPDGFLYRTGTLRRDGANLPDPGVGQDLRFGGFNLAPDERTTITYHARVDEGVLPGSYDNSASLAARDAKGATLYVGPRIASVRIAGVAPPAGLAADLRVRKSGDPDPEPPTPGGLIHYRLEYENRGTAPALDVVLTDDWPIDVAVVEQNGDGGDVLGARIEWRIGTVAPGSSGFVQYTLRLRPDLADGTSIHNAVLATSSTPDANPADNRAIEDLAVGGLPDLVLTKAVTTSPDPATDGAVASYTLTYTNKGVATARAAKITDDYDESKLELEGVPQGGSDAGGVLTVELGDVAPGASGTVTYSAKLRSGQTGSVENTAHAESRLTDAVPSDNTATARFDVVTNEATLTFGGEVVPTRRCHQPQVEVALRGELFETTSAMLASSEFLRAAKALESSPALAEPLLGTATVPELVSKLRTFARLNVEALYLDSGMGLPWQGDVAKLKRDAGLTAPEELTAPVFLPLLSAHPIFAMKRDLGEPWCKHDTHRETTGAAVGEGLAAIAAYAEWALGSGDAHLAFRARVLLDGADRAVTLLGSWRDGALGTPAGHLPSRVLLAQDAAGATSATVADSKARLADEAAVTKGIARLVSVLGAHPEAAPAGAPERAKVLLRALLIDLVRHRDAEGRLSASAEGEASRLDAMATAAVAEAIEAAKSVSVSVPSGLTEAARATLDALTTPEGDVSATMTSGPDGRGPATLEAATAAIRARAALGDALPGLDVFRRMEATLVEGRLHIYRSDATSFGITYTPATLGSLVGGLARLLDAATPLERSTITSRMSLSVEKIAVEAGLQTSLVGRVVDGGGMRLMLGSSGEVKVAPVAADAPHALAPVLLDRVSFLPQGVHHRDLSLVEAAKSLREEGSAVAYLSGPATDCRTAQVRLVDRRFATATGLFAVRAIEDAGLALRLYGEERDDVLLRSFGDELVTTAMADRVTVSSLSGMGVRLRFAPGLDGPGQESARLEAYALAAGLKAAPGTVLPVWLALDGGDPVFGGPVDPREPYGIGWDPSRFAPGLSAESLGQTLLADVRAARAALARGTPLDRFTALVRLHAAALEVAFVDKALASGGAFAAVDLALDSEGRPVELTPVRAGAGLRGNASLLEGVAAYADLLASDPLRGIDPPSRPPVEEDAAARARATLERLVLDETKAGLPGDPMALATAIRALSGEHAGPSSHEAASRLTEKLAAAVPTADVSPLALRGLVLEALAISGAPSASVEAAYRALLDGYLDREWRVFRSGVAAKPDREGAASDAFVLTDLDLGAVFGGLGHALPRLADSAREEAADLLYGTCGRMLYETGLEREHHIEASTAAGPIVATAGALSHAVRVTISDSPVEAGTVYPGDLVRSTFTVQNPTDSSVADETALVTAVPAGLTYLPGSLRVNGQVGADPAAGDSLQFNLGRIGGGESREVTWLLRVSPEASPGSYRVSASARAKSMPGPNGKKLETNPVAAVLPVQSFGSIEGRVFLDLDGDLKDGPSEPGIPDVTLVLDDGTATVTDSEGRYALKSLVPTGYVIKLLEGSVPAPMSPIGAEESRLRVMPAETARASFALKSADVITGIVYRDSNADRRRGAGEDTVAGVVVETGGGERAVTDRSGRYVIRGARTGAQALRLARKQPWVHDTTEIRLEPSPLPRFVAPADSGK